MKLFYFDSHYLRVDYFRANSPVGVNREIRGKGPRSGGKTVESGPFANCDIFDSDYFEYMYNRPVSTESRNVERLW